MASTCWVRRSGSACTALTYALTVPMTIEAAEETGIDAEVIDLRTLDPLGLLNPGKVL